MGRGRARRPARGGQDEKGGGAMLVGAGLAACGRQRGPDAAKVRGAGVARAAPSGGEAPERRLAATAVAGPRPPAGGQRSSGRRLVQGTGGIGGIGSGMSNKVAVPGPRQTECQTGTSAQDGGTEGIAPRRVEERRAVHGGRRRGAAPACSPSLPPSASRGAGRRHGPAGGQVRF